MTTPTIGRIVQYVTYEGAVLPAIITRVVQDDSVNLQVFIDGTLGTEHHVSVPYGEPNDGYPRCTWHWPEVAR